MRKCYINQHSKITCYNDKFTATGLIQTIPSVQRRFAASLPCCKHLTYTKRLKLLHIDSLEKRRLKAHLAFTCNIIFGLVNLNISDFFILIVRHEVILTDQLYSLQLYNKNALHQNLLCFHDIKPWNSLPVKNHNFNHLLILSAFSAIVIFLNCVNINKSRILKPFVLFLNDIFIFSLFLFKCFHPVACYHWRLIRFSALYRVKQHVFTFTILCSLFEIGLLNFEINK